MKELQRKQRIKEALYSWPSLLLVLIIAFFLVKGAIGIMRIERESASRVRELEADSKALALREEKLTLDINKLRTEEGIIEEIKRKFSVTREGEYVAIIIDPKSKATSTDRTGLSWMKTLWDAIIGK